MIAIVIPILLFAFDMIVNITYTIEGEVLQVRVGHFLKQNFDIGKMTEINKSRTILSSPAASLDRIELRFGSDYPLVISPRRKKEFISHLLSVNPNIKVDPRLK